MAIGIGSFYQNSFNAGSIGNVSRFDYKAAQKEVAEKLETYKQSDAKIKTLKKDTADYLSDYTKDMNNLKQSAEKLSGGKLDSLFSDISNGDITEESTKKVTDAVQSLVDNYNATLTNLQKNADRGPGTAQQAQNMAGAPMSDKMMAMIGVSQGKDGTLSFDKAQLTQSIAEAAAGDAKSGTSNRMDLLKDVLGDGFAAGARNKASRGLAASANSLVSNDISNIQARIQEKTQSLTDGMSYQSVYTRSGSVGMLNMATAGLMMNLFA